MLLAITFLDIYHHDSRNSSHFLIMVMQGMVRIGDCSCVAHFDQYLSAALGLKLKAVTTSNSINFIFEFSFHWLKWLNKNCVAYMIWSDHSFIQTENCQCLMWIEFSEEFIYEIFSVTTVFVGNKIMQLLYTLWGVALRHSCCFEGKDRFLCRKSAPSPFPKMELFLLQMFTLPHSQHLLFPYLQLCSAVGC